MNDKLLRIIGTTAVKQIKQRFLQNAITPKTAKSGKNTLVDTGKLLRSVKFRIQDDRVLISAGGAGIPYARILHEGGIIEPKKAKYLAIPLTPEARVAGSPRNIEGQTFISKSIIFKKDGKNIIPLYKLQKQVQIPARPYLFLSETDKNIIIKRIKPILQKEFINGTQ